MWHLTLWISAYWDILISAISSKWSPDRDQIRLVRFSSLDANNINMYCTILIIAAIFRMLRMLAMSVSALDLLQSEASPWQNILGYPTSLPPSLDFPGQVTRAAGDCHVLALCLTRCTLHTPSTGTRHRYIVPHGLSHTLPVQERYTEVLCHL